jgi:hypothetical protein
VWAVWFLPSMHRVRGEEQGRAQSTLLRSCPPSPAKADVSSFTSLPSAPWARDAGFCGVASALAAMAPCSLLASGTVHSQT